jgi:hypothetical protein
MLPCIYQNSLCVPAQRTGVIHFAMERECVTTCVLHARHAKRILDYGTSLGCVDRMFQPGNISVSSNTITNACSTCWDMDAKIPVIKLRSPCSEGMSCSSPSVDHSPFSLLIGIRVYTEANAHYYAVSSAIVRNMTTLQ